MPKHSGWRHDFRDNFSGMSSLMRRGAVLVVLAVTLTACGGSSGDDTADKPATSTAKPAAGDTLTTDDYTYVMPDDWVEAPAGSVPGFDFHSLARESSNSDDFTDNINVIRIDPAQISSIEELEKASVRELEAIHAENITVGDRQDVDGETAVQVSSRASINDVDYFVEQYAMFHDGASYVATFSFGTNVSEDERTTLSQSVMVTWAWT
jgi:hypothetical protein